ncbi:hypothetical protein ASF38_08355 [Aeromicrobium sp. Leaf272]|nr:hypothetical protein ASF38_08355 [Aeromicrobium sp. Leaf272]
MTRVPSAADLEHAPAGDAGLVEHEREVLVDPVVTDGPVLPRVAQPVERDQLGVARRLRWGRWRPDPTGEAFA